MAIMTSSIYTKMKFFAFMDYMELILHKIYFGISKAENFWNLTKRKTNWAGTLTIEIILGIELGLTASVTGILCLVITPFIPHTSGHGWIVVFPLTFFFICLFYLNRYVKQTIWNDKPKEEIIAKLVKEDTDPLLWFILGMLTHILSLIFALSCGFFMLMELLSFTGIDQ